METLKQRSVKVKVKPKGSDKVLLSHKHFHSVLSWSQNRKLVKIDIFAITNYSSGNVPVTFMV